MRAQPWEGKERASVRTGAQMLLWVRCLVLLLPATLAVCTPQRHARCPRCGPRKQQRSRQAEPIRLHSQPRPSCTETQQEGEAAFPARPGSLGMARLWSVFASPRKALRHGSKRAEAAGPHPVAGMGLGGDRLPKRYLMGCRSLENIELQPASGFTRCFRYRQRYSQRRSASSPVNIKQIFRRFIHLHIRIY